MHIFRQDNRPALGVEADVEVTEVDNVIGKRRTQGVIEHVIEIGADFELGVLIKTEELMNAEIHAPCAWSCQKVTLSDVWIVENIGACTRWSKSVRIKDTVARKVSVWIAGHQRTKALSVEVANCIHEVAGYVSGPNRIAVVARNERCEPCARLRKHIPRQLPASSY